MAIRELKVRIMLLELPGHAAILVLDGIDGHDGQPELTDVPPPAGGLHPTGYSSEWSGAQAQHHSPEQHR